MKTVNIKKDPLDLAVRWLLNSGIQSPQGGFYAWYDLDKREHSFLYSEITGYAITTLLFLNSIFKENLYIEKAELAAGWIMEAALHRCGGVLTRFFKQDQAGDEAFSFSGENIYSFDSAVVLYGMANLYKVTKNERYLKASTTLASFLIEKMQNEDGSLRPVYNAKRDEIVSPGTKWSNQPAGFLAKASMGLTDLSEITKDERYHDAAIRLCQHALTTQEDSGRFITEAQSKTTHLHAHCYAAEGLLYTGTSFGRSDFIESAKKATEWAMGHVDEKGINELYDPETGSFNELQRTDILAQVLRLGLIFSADKDKQDALKQILLSYQHSDDHSIQKGGFFYGKGRSHLNAWCAMFSLQALSLLRSNELIPDSKRLDLFI